jgi:hypothetical protein
VTTTLDPVRQATLEVPRQPLRCIGTYSGVRGAVDYPIGWDDASRDTIWVETFLQHLGVSAGDFVAVVSTGHEAPWYAPVVDAVNRLRATVCPLEPARFEVGRALMFFKRFPVSVVIGLDAELGEALEASAGIATVLSRVRSVVSRPDATSLVQMLQSNKGMIAPVGPALALPCLSGSFVHFNEDEWQIDASASGLAVCAKRGRAVGARPINLPDTIRVVERRCECPYGHRSFQLVPAEKDR